MDEFGTMEDFDRMLATAHENIKIMMDLVVNHTSDEHKWFIEPQIHRQSPYRDYPSGVLQRRRKPSEQLGFLLLRSCMGIRQDNRYFLHLFSKKQPDLNWDNPAVRQDVFDMMNWWLKKGVDGFRMDVISLISRNRGF